MALKVKQGENEKTLDLESLFIRMFPQYGEQLLYFNTNKALLETLDEDSS